MLMDFLFSQQKINRRNVSNGVNQRPDSSCHVHWSKIWGLEKSKQNVSSFISLKSKPCKTKTSGCKIQSWKIHRFSTTENTKSFLKYIMPTTFGHATFGYIDKTCSNLNLHLACYANDSHWASQYMSICQHAITCKEIDESWGPRYMVNLSQNGINHMPMMVTKLQHVIVM